MKMKQKTGKEGMKDEKDDVVMHMFGLSIIKEIDPKTKQVHLEIKSKTDGLPMAEAILLVEGWLAAEKEKMIGPVFHPKKDVS
jgi:hypothetical protein